MTGLALHTWSLVSTYPLFAGCFTTKGLLFLMPFARVSCADHPKYHSNITVPGNVVAYLRKSLGTSQVRFGPFQEGSFAYHLRKKS